MRPGKIKKKTHLPKIERLSITNSEEEAEVSCSLRVWGRLYLREKLNQYDTE